MDKKTAFVAASCSGLKFHSQTVGERLARLPTAREAEPRVAEAPFSQLLEMSCRQSFRKSSSPWQLIRPACTLALIPPRPYQDGGRTWRRTSSTRRRRTDRDREAVLHPLRQSGFPDLRRRLAYTPAQANSVRCPRPSPTTRFVPQAAPYFPSHRQHPERESLA